jgi:hypothetical protein
MHWANDLKPEKARAEMVLVNEEERISSFTHSTSIVQCKGREEYIQTGNHHSFARSTQ